MTLDNLTEEQRAKALACKDSAELLRLAASEGVELTDEQLEQVTGGGIIWGANRNCPKCQSERVYNYTNQWFCRSCGHNWTQSPF